MQILKVLQQIGKFHHLSAGIAVGGHNLEEEQSFISKMNILIGTPGRILQHIEFTPDFETSHLQILCIDEADRVLDMGFQNDVLKIIETLPNKRQTILFSATLNKTLQNLARLSLKSPQYINTISKEDGFKAPNALTQYYIECEYQDKLDILFSFVKSHSKEKCIVFFSTCKQVRFAYEAFRKLKLNISLFELHGRQKQMKRTSIFFQFHESQGGYLFSTDVASRGFDFPEVDWVFQVDCPEDYAQYIHRIGRTARFKSIGKSLLLITPQEKEFLNYIKEQHVHKLTLNQTKQMTIKRALQGIIAERQDLKYLAERAFTTYLRGIWLMPDKKVFDVKSVDTQALAQSFGLSSIPNIQFVESQENKLTKLQKLKIKIQQKKNQKYQDKNEENDDGEDFLRIKRKIEPDMQLDTKNDEELKQVLQQEEQNQDPQQIQLDLMEKKQEQKDLERNRIRTKKLEKKIKRKLKISNTE